MAEASRTLLVWPIQLNLLFGLSLSVPFATLDYVGKHYGTLGMDNSSVLKDGAFVLICHAIVPPEPERNLIGSCPLLSS